MAWLGGLLSLSMGVLFGESTAVLPRWGYGAESHKVLFLLNSLASF